MAAANALHYPVHEPSFPDSVARHDSSPNTRMFHTPYTQVRFFYYYCYIFSVADTAVSISSMSILVCTHHCPRSAAPRKRGSVPRAISCACA
jgi:hypothetical protein